MLEEVEDVAGNLAPPFGISLPSPFAYYLVMHEAIAGRAAATAFRTWLAAETAAPRNPSGDPDR